MTNQCLGSDGQSPRGCKSRGYIVALVVAPFLLSAGMERYGYDKVPREGFIYFLEALCIVLPEKSSYIGLLPIFNGVDDIDA